MASLAADPLPIRAEWHVSRIGVACVALALLLYGLALGLSLHHAAGAQTGSLTPAATSTSP
jgi:hypothetical protein